MANKPTRNYYVIQCQLQNKKQEYVSLFFFINSLYQKSSLETYNAD